MKFLSSRRINCRPYQGQVPFAHCVIDGLFLPAACRAVADSIPSLGPRWCIYDNPLERKNVLNDRSEEAEPIRELYDVLGDDGFIDLIEQITELSELVWDPSLHAGGICATGAGGKLDLHRDGQSHPHMPWERALSLVLFLNDGWEPDWGGNLELWSERDGQPHRLEESIQPTLGRLVLFDHNGFHGYPDPLRCPDGVTRKSVQVFYWKPAASDTKAGRERASFSPRPQDKPDPLLDKLRAERLLPRGLQGELDG